MSYQGNSNNICDMFSQMYFLESDFKTNLEVWAVNPIRLTASKMLVGVNNVHV